MSKNIIIVTEDERNAIQKADFECSARMNLILFLMKNDIGLNNDRFIEYQNDYIKYFQAFEEAKANLENTYFKNKINNVASWSLDYDTCELTYET